MPVMLPVGSRPPRIKGLARPENFVHPPAGLKTARKEAFSLARPIFEPSQGPEWPATSRSARERHNTRH